ncbi:MAG: hypothetical protein Q9217_005750 [Psora testacea]
MPLPQSPIPTPAQPIRKSFDPWNSSSTGHQRAENRLSGGTSWRQSRTLKLSHQFSSGAGGGKRVFDTVGAGSKDFDKDGRKENGGWDKGAKGLRGKGDRDVSVILSRGSKEEMEIQEFEGHEKENELPGVQLGLRTDEDLEQLKRKKQRGIFRGLTIYINGSTAPLVSDHKLKHILAENGARLSISLGRRSVTHVIVGKPNGTAGGAGGGLSGSKIEKEIQRVKGCGIKFVGVEWALESLKAGKRLPERHYEGIGIAPKGVSSVANMFKKQYLRRAESID